MFPRHALPFFPAVCLLAATTQAGAQACTQPPSGLLGWWPGDGNPNDLVVGRHANLGAGATFGDGAVGQAFLVDGIDDTIQIPFDTPFDFPPGSSITIDAWIRPTRIEVPPGFTVYGGPILAKGQDNGSRNYWFAIGGDDGQARLSFAYSGAAGLVQYSTSTFPIRAGEWHHAAVSYAFGNAASIRLYVDGQQVPGSWTAGTGNESVVVNDFLPRIGGEEDQLANDRFTGYIDEVELFSRALSPSEIQEVFSAGSAGKCKSPSAHAGPDQTVDENAVVALGGSASDPLDNPLTIAWTQVGGPSVALSDASILDPTFTAPAVPAGGAVVSLQLAATSSLGTSDPDTVNVTIKNVNNRPVAETTGDMTVPENSLVTLDGRPSYDVDDEPLTFSWVQSSGTQVTLTGETSSTPSFTAPAVGSTGETLAFRIVVNDGIDDSEAALVEVSVTNVNQAPTASAGADASVPENSQVLLAGSGSDPDDDALTYLWTQTGGPGVVLSDPTSPNPSVWTPFVSPGGESLTFSLVVSDGVLSSVTDEVVLTVLNTNDPPSCTSTTASPGHLWPPNHKLLEVGIGGIVDPQGDTVSVSVTAVSSDEPTSGLGDGDSSPDAVIQGDGVLLRAERWDLGDGRVYTVHFTATDSNGESCAGSVTIGVAKNARKETTAVDSGQGYDATLP